MPWIEILLRLIFRIAELCFAAIVLGADGQYMAENSSTSNAALAPFIYTMIVAGLSVIAAVFRMLPTGRSLVFVPIDVAMTVMWWIVFGIAVSGVGGDCGDATDWKNINLGNDACGKLKAGIAFSFLSALLWLISAVANFFWDRSAERRAKKKTSAESTSAA